MARSVVLHGHFYQPPRENPWLDVVETEASAAPYHDWNRRVEQECYRAVAAARVPDASGRIARIVNTLAWISFDFGATLLEWMEVEAPRTYGAVLDADRESRRRVGFGNAVAAPFHHVILPLSTRRDKVTEVRWGIADFRRRFGREPEGMWLPETAVDDDTLDVLAAHGIAFTILGPHQVGHAPADGRPLRYRTGGGREIALFVYDGPLSHDVAFGTLLDDAYAWARRLLGEAAAGGAVDGMVSLATDGETFGHHHRFGEMALAKVLDLVAARPDAAVTNYAAVLAARPPVERATLVAPSAWSCPHGVERWRSDCGCRIAPERHWNQKWRAPLRAALDWLADELHGVFAREGGALFTDPLAARDAYAESFGPPGGERDPLAAQARRGLSPEEAVRARELLLMERDALALFTSCAWFFDDIGGLEPLESLRYAAHAIELTGAAAPALHRELAERLSAAHSNDPAIGDGGRIYRERARPSVPPPARVAGSYAALRRFAGAAASATLYGYDVSGEDGRVRLVHRRTGRAHEFEVGIERTDGWRFAVTVTPAGPGATPCRMDLGALTEAERDIVTRAMVAAIARRRLSAEADDALCEGRAAMPDVVVAALLDRVEALGREPTDEARATVSELLDLLELLRLPVPFDVQSAFERARGALPPAEAHALAGLAARLGFSLGG